MDIAIRRMRQTDLEALYALLSDPQVMRYLEPPYDKARTEAFLGTAGLSEPPRIYAVDRDGVFTGYVICHAFDERSLEIGWVLRPDCWGKGVASRCTELLLERGREEKKDLILECVPEQAATRHLAEKYGFVYEGNADGLDVFRKKQ